MVVIPAVKISELQATVQNKPGMAGKVAIVGAFDSTETSPVSVLNMKEAYTKLGTDTSYMGVACIDKLFNAKGGVSSLLAINITTKTGSGQEQVINKELTTTKLSEALSKIKGEDFDILFVADNLTIEGLTIVKTFLSESYELKKPNGLVAPINRTTIADYATATALFNKDFLYAFITQKYLVPSLSSTELSLIESAAYHCGLIAGSKVNKSMTMKKLEGVAGLNPEYSFETGDDGYTLLQDGISVAKCLDRSENYYVVVNSELPNGMDLAINRTKDFIIKQFNLEKYLGEYSSDVTLTGIKSELESVKQYCVDEMELLEDITYSVVKTNKDSIDIYLNSLKFKGIVTTINVHVKIEVE